MLNLRAANFSGDAAADGDQNVLFQFAEKLVERKPNVFDNLSQQKR
jgi:hypothetical protein